MTRANPLPREIAHLRNVATQTEDANARRAMLDLLEWLEALSKRVESLETTSK